MSLIFDLFKFYIVRKLTIPLRFKGIKSKNNNQEHYTVKNLKISNIIFLINYSLKLKAD